MKSKVIKLAQELHESSEKKFYNDEPSMVGFAVDVEAFDLDAQGLFSGAFSSSGAIGVMLTLIATIDELEPAEKEFLLTLAEKFKENAPD